MAVVLHCAACTEWARQPTLRGSIDAEFTDQVLEQIRAEFPEATGELRREERVSFVAADITELDAPRVAQINGEKMIYAASMPKIAILLSAFVEIDRGVLDLDDDLLAKLTRMIRNSSNQAATEVYEKVGPERIAEILQSEPHRLYDPDYGGGLWVGRGFGGGETWRRDPEHGISHGASAMQVARFYYLLKTGRLVSAASTERMLEILSRPEISHKFVAGLKYENADAAVFRKSGTWREFHADGGIVVDPHYSYILVAIVKDEGGASILERLVGAIDEAVKRRHVD